jgi:hypothetical protein
MVIRMLAAREGSMEAVGLWFRDMHFCVSCGAFDVKGIVMRLSV